jgi:hypothetical protein
VSHPTARFSDRGSRAESRFPFAPTNRLTLASRRREKRMVDW